jgi:predicted Zn-dependent protease
VYKPTVSDAQTAGSGGPVPYKTGRISAFKLLLLLCALALSTLGATRLSAQASADAGTLDSGPDLAQVAIPVQSLPQLPDPIPTKPAAPATTTKNVPAKYDVSKIGARGIGAGMNLYSLDKETTLGKQLSLEVEQSTRLVTDPVVTEYVNRIGQNIVRNSDAKVPFTIKVIDDDEVNAFALPGGFFYVNSGLILAADNEAELAGVMAHEIAHVAARHATKNATRSQLWNLVSIPLIFAGGPAGYAVREAAGLLLPMSFLKFSRNAEQEADLLGVEYEYAAGYDPQAFVEFFEKLEVHDKKHHSAIAKAFSTHPMTEDRVKAAQRAIAIYLPPREEYVVTTSDFEDVKERLNELTNRTRLQISKQVRPTLRRRDSAPPGTSDPKDDDNQRPTLKRAPGSTQGSPSSPGTESLPESTSSPETP